jgi:hypothetical protein
VETSPRPICQEVRYEFAVHTRFNDSHGQDPAVFITLVGKEEHETRKFLLQFPDNTIHPFLSDKTDLFHFVDQDIGAVSEIGN